MEEGEVPMTESLLQKLKQYHNTMLPMHMPGHKRNLALSGEDGYLAALCADCDITEVAGFDNLAEPEDLLLNVNRRAAALWHSEEAYLLVNGSTCGILAAIYATVPREGRVVLTRNCHKSVYNGLRLVNAKTSYLLPEEDTLTGTYGAISPEAVEAALKGQERVQLLIVTSPTYEGILSDVEEICRIAHAYGVPVLVDSAHGAHLGFGAFPKGAVECGADLVVQSLHKTLPSLTQTAVLHRNGTLVNGNELRNAINLFQTSSPSYLLLASMEGCISLLEKQGEQRFADWEKALDAFYMQVAKLKHLFVAGSEERAVRDPGKLVICTAKTNLSGSELMERLRKEYCIEAEMAAERYVIAMTGMGDTTKSLLRLAEALCAIDADCESGDEDRPEYPHVPLQKMSAEEALLQPKEEKLLENAVGSIAAEYVWAYPPGIPILVPGEEISEELLRFLSEKKRLGIRLHRSSAGDEAKVLCVEKH